MSGGVLHLSYSLQPHVVLRCAWSGGSCRVVYNSSADLMGTYDTLRQGLRGGTPYAPLSDGSMLAAMHTKDNTHAPSLLYSIIFYSVEQKPPFRVLSISPKLCLSEGAVELAISPKCALQVRVASRRTTYAHMHKHTPMYVDVHSMFHVASCLLYTSPSPRDKRQSRMPSSA